MYVLHINKLCFYITCNHKEYTNTDNQTVWRGGGWLIESNGMEGGGGGLIEYHMKSM